MKKITFFFSIAILCSCTSNTILEPPKDLISKDSMSILFQELMIASSAKFIKTKELKKGINYMPLVYEKFKIDSSRFQRSSLYYLSKIDEYIEIFEDANKSLEKKKAFYDKIKNKQDSLRKDSLTKLKSKPKIDTSKIKKPL